MNGNSPTDALLRMPGILRHLCRLTTYLPLPERHVAYIHIYAKVLVDTPLENIHMLEPALAFPPAADQGYEGIACVDDVARAANLALQVYELSGAPGALTLGCAWLRFVRFMQSESDGRLLNFILDADGTRSGNAVNSYPGGEPWTVRSLQSFAMAWRILRDEAFLQRFWRTVFPPTTELRYLACYALAALNIYQTLPDPGLRHWITDLCTAIVDSGPGYFRNAPGKEEVELYGYVQLEAVARAGAVLGERQYIAACKETVRHLIEPVIRDGFYHVYPTQRDHQSVFDLSPLALGLEALYQATDEARYRDLALQCVSWLDGNNPAGRAVYDAEVGRCHDNINLQGEIAPTAGAESAIEAGFMQLVRYRLQGTDAGLTFQEGEH